MHADDVLALLHTTADAIASALVSLEDWALADDRLHAGQYRHDQVADRAALEVLGASGLSVLSEESGLLVADPSVTVVIDPVDGSTNASRRLPWWATSLCAVDDEGPWVSLVVDQVAGTRFAAVRGGGATRDGVPFVRPVTPPLGASMIGLGGLPPFHFGWAQFRSFGASALDLCAVADGRLDGYVHCVTDEIAPWDYLGAVLVCAEAGALVVDASDRELTEIGHGVRRTIVAAGDERLLAELVAARRRFD